MTREQIIEKVRKVAALANSPVEGERIAATLKLKLMMEEYHLTLQDLGYSSTTSFNRSLVVAIDRKSSADLNPSDIKEIYYLHSNLPEWLNYMICVLGDLYDVYPISLPDKIKLVGFKEDLEVYKHMLVNVRRLMEEGIARYGYSDRSSINSFVYGLLVSISSTIRNDPNFNMDLKRAKKFHVNYYVSSHFNIYRGNLGLSGYCNRDAYNTGHSDGNGFRWSSVAVTNNTGQTTCGNSRSRLAIGRS